MTDEKLDSVIEKLRLEVDDDPFIVTHADNTFFDKLFWASFKAFIRLTSTLRCLSSPRQTVVWEERDRRTGNFSDWSAMRSPIGSGLQVVNRFISRPEVCYRVSAPTTSVAPPIASGPTTPPVTPAGRR